VRMGLMGFTMGIPPPPPLGGGGGLARSMPTNPPTLSIRRQHTDERRLRYRRRQALRYRHRWDRRRRCCRCTHRRTPLARWWRGWRLRSADQSSNSCVQSSAKTTWTQEKKAEKRKIILRKSLTAQPWREYNGVSQGDTPPPPPGGGG